MHSEKDIISTINKNFPALNFNSVLLAGEGWMSRAYLVNDEFIFRFPKSAESANDLDKEISFLPKIVSRISLRIPEFKFIGKQLSGLTFVGYKKLPGEIIGENDFVKLSKTTQTKITSQLADFLDELQAVLVGEAKECGVPVIDFRENFRNDSLVLNELKAELPVEVFTYLVNRYHEYLNNDKYFDYTPTLLHADLSPNHFLYNRNAGELTGIIDFGDMQIGDPDYEYKYMYQDIGPEFVRQVMELRGESNIQERMKKISLFSTFDHWQYYLGGRERGLKDWMTEAVECLQIECDISTSK